MDADDHGSDHSGSHTSDHRDGDEDDHTDVASDGRVLGSVFVAGNSLIRNLYVYYDETSDANMASSTTQAEVNRTSWDQLNLTW